MNLLKFWIAVRSFFSVRESSFISFTTWMTLFGISVGVMSLIVVLSVINGFEYQLRKNMIDVQSHLVLHRGNEGIKHWESLQKKIKDADSRIQNIFPMTYNEVLFAANGRVTGGVLQGVSETHPMPFFQKSPRKIPTSHCFVGKELAKKLNLTVGSKVKIILPIMHQNHDPKVFELMVEDLFDAGLYEYSSRYVYANLREIQQQLGWKDKVAAFQILVTNPEEAMEVGKSIREKVSYAFVMRSWMTMNQNLFLAIKIQKAVIAIVLAGIISVAMFNVMSSLIMIVMSKIKEISILKALGMSSVQIQNIFLYQGLLMGILGTVLGIGLAYVMCLLLAHFRFIELSPDIYYLSFLPVQIRWSEVGYVGLGIVITSCLSAYFPARRASKVYPVEGIRYE